MSALVLLILLVAVRAFAGLSGPSGPVRPDDPDPSECHGTVTVSLLIVAGFASAATWSLDDDTVFSDRLSEGSLAGVIDFGNTWGDGRVIGGASLGMWVLGAAGGDGRTRALGADLTRSFLLSSLATAAIKHAVDRKRPNGGRYSFPSGHTSAAFSVVPALHHHLGWAASGPAAALGVLTALGRMQDRYHYLSDVIFGGVLGWAAGDLALRVLRRKPGSGNVFLGPGVAGYAAPF